MAVYSTYDYGTKLYTYWDDGKPAPTHAGAPKIMSLGGIGVAPEQAAWRLPPCARKVGAGDLPKGKIASTGALGGVLPSSPVGIAVLAVGAYFAWKHLR